MKLIYVDMDDTICGYTKYRDYMLSINPTISKPQSQYGFFTTLPPIPLAINSINQLQDMGYEVWILTRPSVKNPLCYTEKRVWVENYLGMEFVEKLIISPDKGLLKGDYLIDDYPWPKFEGTQLLFGSQKYPTWVEVISYFKNKN